MPCDLSACRAPAKPSCSIILNVRKIADDGGTARSDGASALCEGVCARVCQPLLVQRGVPHRPIHILERSASCDDWNVSMKVLHGTCWSMKHGAFACNTGMDGACMNANTDMHDHDAWSKDHVQHKTWNNQVFAETFAQAVADRISLAHSRSTRRVRACRAHHPAPALVVSTALCIYPGDEIVTVKWPHPEP